MASCIFLSYLLMTIPADAVSLPPSYEFGNAFYQVAKFERLVNVFFALAELQGEACHIVPLCVDKAFIGFGSFHWWHVLTL